MLTVSELVEIFSDLTGTRPQEGRLRARHLREAGLLPSGGRGRGAPKVDAVHCVHYIVAWLAAERTINSPEAVRHLQHYIPTTLYGNPNAFPDDVKAALLTRAKRPTSTTDPEAERPLMLLPGQSFIEALARMIEWGRTKTGLRVMQQNLAAIACSRDGPVAYIDFKGAEGELIRQKYEPVPPGEKSHGRMFTNWQLHSISVAAPIMVEASLSAVILGWLSEDLGYQERDCASIADVKLGFDDDVDNAQTPRQ